MNDEEKKAFQYYKECNEKDLENYEYLHEECQKQTKYLEILLNLIEKQSKEIEELKEDRDKFKKALGKRIIYCNELEKDLFENCSNYVVSKDKIKAKIEDILNSENGEAIEKLIEWQSLLEKE